MKSTDKSSTLKQGTLEFPSIKRTTSVTQAKGKKPVRSLSTPTAVSQGRDSISNASTSETSDPIVSSSSEDKPDVGVREKKPIPKRKEGTGNVKAREVIKNGQSVEDGVLGSLNLRDVTGRLRKHYGEVRKKMGNIEPVHSEGQTQVHHILRVFDLSYEYGPCIGVTRLERWQRAFELGLNPPTEVRDILLTKDGQNETQYSQCVFYNEV